MNEDKRGINNINMDTQERLRGDKDNNQKE